MTITTDPKNSSTANLGITTSTTMLKVKTLKVAELKEELSKRGLDTKGLKKDVSASLVRC